MLMHGESQGGNRKWVKVICNVVGGIKKKVVRGLGRVSGLGSKRGKEVQEFII